MASAAPQRQEDIEAASSVESVSEGSLENLRFEAGKLELGEFWDGKAAEADALAKTELQQWSEQGTKFGTRYETALTPIEQAAVDAAAKEATQAAADMKAAGALNIKGFMDALASLKLPVQLRKDQIIHPTEESQIISSEDVAKTEADLGDVIPDRAEVKHDVSAELTTPAPDKPKVDYTKMSLPELQKEYDRLFAATEADLKANPDKLKAYKKALKTGIVPKDPEAENSELNKVYAEINARRAGKAPVVAEAPEAPPVAARKEPPPPPPARVVVEAAPEPPVVKPVEKHVVTREEAYKEASTAYFKRFDKAREYVADLLKKGDEPSRQKAEGYLTGLILTAENTTSDDMLSDGLASGLITKEQLEAVSGDGKIEVFQDEVISHLRNMLADVKKGGAVRTPEQITAAEAPTAVAKAVEAPPAPAAVPKKEIVAPAPPPAAPEKPKAEKKAEKKVELPKRDEVRNHINDQINKQMAGAYREPIRNAVAKMSWEQANRLASNLKERFAKLKDEDEHQSNTAMESELKTSLGLTDEEINSLTDDDLDTFKAALTNLLFDVSAYADEEALRKSPRDGKPEAPKKTT